MNLTTHQPQQEKAVFMIDRLQRWFFAGGLVLGTAAALVTVVANPGYYSLQSGAVAFIAAFTTANVIMSQIHLVSMVITAYLLPLSLLTMAWLAMRRSPWLASIAALIVFLGVSPLAVFAAQDASFYDVARLGSHPLLVTAVQQFNTDGIMSYYNAAFNFGMILGPTLVGIALIRARAIPLWAAILITLSRPLVFIYPFIPSLPGIYVQLPSCALLFLGSIPAALAILKGRGEDVRSVERGGHVDGEVTAQDDQVQAMR
ncbi:MAG TPA: hypothetical protein VKX46_00830 [Ktedonobacteraceae bacterium]|nr:hypothetical protein [Ktedonobacteraceae bacterium]